jgi:hypothetical protein
MSYRFLLYSSRIGSRMRQEGGMGKRVALVPHLTTARLVARYKATRDAATARRWHLLWLISAGKTRDEAAQTVGVSSRWASTLIARDNAAGVAGLEDGRHANPGAAPLLNAAAWMATHAGVRTNPKRGIVYLRRLGRTPQVPRPCHVAAATPEEQAAFHKV